MASFIVTYSTGDRGMQRTLRVKAESEGEAAELWDQEVGYMDDSAAIERIEERGE